MGTARSWTAEIVDQMSDLRPSPPHLDYPPALVLSHHLWHLFALVLLSVTTPSTFAFWRGQGLECRRKGTRCSCMETDATSWVGGNSDSMRWFRKMKGVSLGQFMLRVGGVDIIRGGCRDGGT